MHDMATPAPKAVVSEPQPKKMSLTHLMHDEIEHAFSYKPSRQHQFSQVISSSVSKQLAEERINPAQLTQLAPAQPILTNEEKTLRHYLEHDIVGLSIFSASSHSKYSMKINTLRQHLTSMDDHPLVRLKDYFREILEQYIKKQTKAIDENFKYYDMDRSSTELAAQHKKLFDKVVKEIKSFVTLMHDAVVRFYILDIKVGMSYKQNEHLTNLLTSLVLKNPVYSEVHAIIRLQQRPQLKRVVQTIHAIRSKYGRNLEDALKIDPVAIGQAIYRTKQEAEAASA